MSDYFQEIPYIELDLATVPHPTLIYSRIEEEYQRLPQDSLQRKFGVLAFKLINYGGFDLETFSRTGGKIYFHEIYKYKRLRKTNVLINSTAFNKTPKRKEVASDTAGTHRLEQPMSVLDFYNNKLSSESFSSTDDDVSRLLETETVKCHPYKTDYETADCMNEQFGASNIFNPLSMYSGDLRGIKTCNTLIGERGTVSSTHQEDLNFSSVNLTLYGQSQLWYVPRIPPERSSKTLEDFIRQDCGKKLDQLAGWKFSSCDAMMRTKCLALHPDFYKVHQIPCLKIRQEVGVLICTLPGIWHTVVKIGKNLSTAMNVLPTAAIYYEIPTNAHCLGHYGNRSMVHGNRDIAEKLKQAGIQTLVTKYHEKLKEITTGKDLGKYSSGASQPYKLNLDDMQPKEFAVGVACMTNYRVYFPSEDGEAILSGFVESLESGGKSVCIGRRTLAAKDVYFSYEQCQWELSRSGRSSSEQEGGNLLGAILKDKCMQTEEVAGKTGPAAPVAHQSVQTDDEMMIEFPTTRRQRERKERHQLGQANKKINILHKIMDEKIDKKLKLFKAKLRKEMMVEGRKEDREPAAKPDKRFQCMVEGCAKKFPRRDNLARHVQLLHSKGVDVYFCKLCHAHFTRKDNLSAHERRWCRKRQYMNQEGGNRSEA